MGNDDAVKTVMFASGHVEDQNVTQLQMVKCLTGLKFLQSIMMSPCLHARVQQRYQHKLRGFLMAKATYVLFWICDYH